MDLARHGDTVSGQVMRYGGPSHAFSGWVALFALLDRLLGGARFEPAAPGPDQPLHRPRGTGRTLPGPHSACTELVGDLESRGAYSALELVLPPGGEEPARMYRHQEMGLYIAEGEGVLQLGPRSVVGRTGDFFNIPRGCLHAFRNDGPTPVRALLTLVPAEPAGYGDASAQDAPVDEVGSPGAAGCLRKR